MQPIRENKNRNYASGIIPFLPLMALGIWVFLDSLHYTWVFDDFAYKYIMPFDPGDEESVLRKVDTLEDILVSQHAHYLVQNGRFLCHFIVQFFCGIAGKTWFAACNALMWMAFVTLLLKCARISIAKFSNTFIASLSAILIFSPLNMGPAFQINYVWMGTLSFLWAYIFITNGEHRRAMMPLWIIFSIAAGSAQESFSLPISAAALLWMIARRKDTSRFQIAMAISFWAGVLANILAPGIRMRIGATIPPPLLNAVTPVIPSLLLMLLGSIYTAISLRHRNPGKKLRDYLSSPESDSLFWIIMLSVSFLMSATLRFASGQRILTCMYASFAILFLRNLRLTPFVKAALAAAIIGIAAFETAEWGKNSLLNVKFKELDARFINSPDGTVILPDTLYLAEYRNTNLYKADWRRSGMSRHNAGKIAIYPESARMLPAGNDTNAIVRIGEQAWLIMQSRRKPARFIVRKRILPGILGMRMSDREINLTDPDIMVDSTQACTIAVYANERQYMESELIMENIP